MTLRKTGSRISPPRRTISGNPLSFVLLALLGPWNHQDEMAAAAVVKMPAILLPMGEPMPLQGSGPGAAL
jgi:hypothetical protein